MLGTNMRAATGPAKLAPLQGGRGLTKWIGGPGLAAGARRLRGWLVGLLLFLPTLVAGVYFGLVATDRYVSEAHFVVRSATRSSVGSGFAAFLQMAGISRSQDDTFAVHDFIGSRDAVVQLMEKLPLAEIYGRPEADALSAYPNIYYRSTIEELHKYLKSRIAVIYNANTGISTLQVEAFRPEDAPRVADALLELSENVINRMNTRIRDDGVRLALEEVKRSEERAIAAQLAITDFRNREVILDPGRSSVHVVELIARLSAELSNVTALIAEVTASSPSSPQLPPLERRAAAMREQIALERARITDASDGLAQKIAHYEHLTLEREFANRSLGSAFAALDTARSEARRQQLYLERIAGPSTADKAEMPRRLVNVASVFAINVILLMIAWLINTGLGNHAPKIARD
jgi:capsular polysaccharide transport system permease protein